MKSQTVWLLLVSFLLVCGTIGCGQKPEAMVQEPKTAVEDPKTVVSKPVATEEPKPAPKKPETADWQLPPDAPQPAIAPFDADQAKQHQQAWAEHLGVPVEHTNSIGMKLKLIPAGEFMMGSPESDDEARDSEKPQHKVKITKPFYLGVTEVTQGQWKSVMGTEPWKGERCAKEGTDYAASYVSWDDAVAFCEKLSSKEGVTYRLPSEAEWEYACRAGTTTVCSFADDIWRLGDYAWFRDNAYDVDQGYAHRVGQKKPNPWGLFDVHGNLWEWCSDWYGAYGSEKAVSDPKGPAQGEVRVLRGESFNDFASVVRSAFRYNYLPVYRNLNNGFRVARTYP